MAASLNQIVDSLSDIVGKPFDVPLKRRIKHIVNYKRDTLMHQFLDRHPEQRRFFLQSWVMTLKKSSPVECPLPLPGNCFVLKTTAKTPRPIRNKHFIFDYVGGVRGDDPYSYWDMAYSQFLKYNTYTSKRPKHYWADDYLYIINEASDRKVLMRGVISNPESVNACAETVCYNDDLPYPIAEDLLNIVIKDILSTELKMILPAQEDVDIDNDDDRKQREV